MSYRFNVQAAPYNAAGDGTTDDTQAIQGAIDDAKDAANAVYNGDDGASATGVGATVFVPKGTYLTTEPLKLPPTITLMGEGTGSLINSLFDTEPPVPFDQWRGAIELSPSSDGRVMQAGVRNLSIFTNSHCGITYNRAAELWPAEVFTFDGSTYTSRISVNNDRFRTGSYTVLSGANDFLYVGFAEKADLLPGKGMEGTGGLFWTRMKQLGFQDKWGTRLDLEWQYSSGNDGSGQVNDWTIFTPTAELGGGFWHYGHNGTYTHDFSDDWEAGNVNASARLYWIRVRATSAIHQAPEAHHVYPGVQVVPNMCTFENLYFNCGNWAIFFGLFTYCQHCRFRGIRTVRNNGGCIWVVGNSNYVSECDTEGGSRDPDISAVTDPGQFTIEGDGNTIRDIIAEGGPKLQYPWYCFRGAGFIGENLWVENPGFNPPDQDRVDTYLQQVRGAVFDRPPGVLRLENAHNVIINQAELLPDTSIADFVTLIGDSTITIDNLFGYRHPGDMDNPRIRWNQFHSFTNRGVPLLPNVSNPVTGNLVVNGDFQNGLHGWTLATQSGTTTGDDHEEIQDAPDGRGKELVFDITGDTGGGVFIETTVNIPPGYEGYDAFVGFRADTDGNVRYERRIRDDGELPDNYFSSLLNSQSAYRIRRIGFDGTNQNSTHTLRLRVVTSADAYNAALKYDGTTYTPVNTLFPSATTILEATNHHFYLGADLPVKSIAVNVQTASSDLLTVIEYWNGSEWETVDDLEDDTNSFATTGTNTISFTTPRGRWQKRFVGGVGPAYWVRFRATGLVSTAPVIASMTRNREGKFYLSNVYCVIGQVHNQLPSLQAQRRWPDGRVELTGTTTPPTTGTWKVGDVIWNSNPSAGGSIGIVCTTAGSGSNAVWKTFGSITS